MDKLVISTHPHIRINGSIPSIMWNVVGALMPALAASIYFFGLSVLWVILSSVISAVVTEVIVQAMLKRPITISDGSAVVTGILLAFCLPPGVPIWLPAVGSFVAIAIAKHCFGGLGWNVFNPAMIGRAFLLASWPVWMTRWHPVGVSLIDSTTTASPLGILKEEGMANLLAHFGNNAAIMYQSLFLGNVAGSLGETSCVMLLLGAAWLLYKGYITWHIPLSFLGTIALLTWIFGGQYLFYGDPLLAILSGGAVLGAFFIATDMVTSPVTKKGQLIFGAGAGALVVLIRLKAGYPEGVCYAVLLMNALTPLIDRYIKPKIFGEKKDAKAA